MSKPKLENATDKTTYTRLREMIAAAICEHVDKDRTGNILVNNIEAVNRLAVYITDKIWRADEAITGAIGRKRVPSDLDNT